MNKPSTPEQIKEKLGELYIERFELDVAISELEAQLPPSEFVEIFHFSPPSNLSRKVMSKKANGCE